jgi:hypothetical protein
MESILKSPVDRARRALDRVAEVRALAGHWPATKREVKDGLYAHRQVPVRGLRPSARVAMRNRAVARKQFEIDRAEWQRRYSAK